jgi:signal transduction histidine kinase/phage shock protein PspC (stress-responsive transcriptional regulator)
VEQLTGSPPASRPASATRPRLARRAHGKLIAGVAGGIGDRFQIEPNVVRLAFVVLTLAGGAGALLYAAGWLWLPVDDGAPPATWRGRQRSDWVQVAALGAVVLGALLLSQSMGLRLPDAIVWPVVLAAMGTALIVGRSGRPIDELIGDLVRTERDGATRAALLSRDTHAITRVVLGGALVVGGVIAFLATQGAFEAFGQVLVAVVVVAGGLALIFGPWLWRLSHALVEERAERIRSDERAEMAAHLHDSVLQTLAMVQRRADDPRAVVALARRQERELRAWLFGRAPSLGARDLGVAVEGAAADVEQREGVPIDVVRVGPECALDDHMRALVFAAREAMVNAARHSGAPFVAVYVEVEAEMVTVFVRDRGRGFDVDAISADRGGLAESVRGRMRRHGGAATIRSRPGEGTEVELTMRRQPA